MADNHFEFIFLCLV